MAAKKEPKTEEEELTEQLKKLAPNDVCKSGDKTYKVGDTWMEKGKCVIHACHPGGLISVMTCPHFLYDKKRPEPYCQVVPGDDTLEYPECCEYIYCKKPDTGNTVK